MKHIQPWLGVLLVYLGLCIAFVLLLMVSAEEDDGVGLCMNCEHGPDRHHARMTAGFIVWNCLARSWREDSCECDHYRPRVRQICRRNSSDRIPTIP